MSILRHDISKFQNGFDLKVLVYAYPQHSLWFFNCSNFLNCNWKENVLCLLFLTIKLFSNSFLLFYHYVMWKYNGKFFKTTAHIGGKSCSNRIINLFTQYPNRNRNCILYILQTSTWTWYLLIHVWVWISF